MIIFRSLVQPNDPERSIYEAHSQVAKGAPLGWSALETRSEQTMGRIPGKKSP